MLSITLSSIKMAIIYLDSNVFIFAATDTVKGKKSREIIKDIIEGKNNGFTASLTIDEVLWKIWKETKNRDFAISEATRILKFDNLKIVNVDKTNIALSLGLMSEHKKLKLRDAIHLSSALINGCTKIVSDDSDFDDIEGIDRIKIE